MCSEHCQGHGHHGSAHAAVEGCCRAGGRVRGFIQPRLLLLLVQQPDYGYALLERLDAEGGASGADPGLLYRTLRQMEADGLLQSTWDTEGQGPARRRYEVTPKGVEMLHAWAVRIEQTRQRLDAFLADYQECFQVATEEDAV